MGAVLAFTHYLEATTCCNCGVEFAFPQGLHKSFLKSHAPFYCPNGHSQHFTGEPDEVELKRQLEHARKALDDARAATVRARKAADDASLSARLTRGKLNALKKRVKHGVCPCCQRSFVQLARHMASQHPEYHQQPEIEDQT